MPISANEVYIIDHTLYRLLYIDDDYTKVALINLEKEIFPSFMEMKEFLSNSKKMKDPFAKVISPEALPEKHVDKMNRKWEIISKVIEEGPDVYNKGYRNQVISQIVKETNCKRRFLVRNLYRYWQRGMNRFALLPDYDNVGKAIPKDGQGKPGRKRNIYKKSQGTDKESEDLNGLAITESILTIFRDYFRYYNSRANKVSLKYVHRLMLTEQFSDTKCKPSYHQFIRRYEQEYNHEQKLRFIEGEKKFRKDRRHITGNSTEDVRALGEVYQIDATVADVYLVSKLNRKDVIDRPTLYFAVDVFSRMITGFYCGFANASQEAAMNLILNCASDKVEFCKKYDIEIDEKDWPSKHLPQAFLCDNGEMHGERVKGLAEHFSVTFQYTGSYSPDMKGIVERTFRSFHDQIKPSVPGFVLVDYGQRGGVNYKKKAVLT